ncbi:MAG: hypothetical protein U0L66_08220 [Acutalibacteraceae bacterium]|nr:hypothetical protein [Acutalibacteraceae bacterium]
MTDKSEINKINDIRESKASAKDKSETLSNHIRQLWFSEKDSTRVHIVFVDGGGSYNSQTGEAQGVAGVEVVGNSQQQATESEQVASGSTTESEQVATQRDSVGVLNQQNDIESEKTIGSSWLVWLLVGMGAMFVAIVVLRRLPQTRWLFSWI